MRAAVTSAVERWGAVLATVTNLYPYGLPDRPMLEESTERPRGSKARLCARMWAEAERAHREGRLPELEVRVRDYVDPGTRRWRPGPGPRIGRIAPSG